MLRMRGKRGNTLSDPKAVTVWSRVESVDAPAELGLTLRLSWNHSADELWKRLDPALWEATKNPWIVLQTVFKGEVQPARAPMILGKHYQESPDMVFYSAEVSATRPASDYTARVAPYHPNASAPLELSQILWQR